MWSFLWLASMLVALLRPAPCGGEATPVAPEFQTNAYTTGAQDIPQVVGLPDGGFVVVWQSQYQDGDQDGIVARRYTAAGTPAGDEFQVNTWTTGNQQRPAVAADPAGNFVVVWQSYAQEGTSDSGVFARRHSAAGVPDGVEFAVNEYTTGNQNRPAVAAAPDGTFVVAWASYQQDGDFFGIFARRFPSGAPAGAEFQVNTWTTGTQYHPAVGVSATGDFVVVWDGPGQFGDDVGVLARRYTSSGAPLAEFQVNAHTIGNQYRPALAMNSGGDFVVAWNGDGVGDPVGIFARRVAAAGVPAGDDFQVNTYTTGTQYRAAVAADVAGSFAVVWQGQDDDSYGIFARQFSHDGTPVGGETQTNTYTTSEQGRPGIAMQSNGDFVVVWRSYAQDGTNFGSFAQRFAGPITSTTTSSTAPGGGGGSTSTTLVPNVPLSLRSLLVRPDAVLKVVASGPLTLADPTASGAALALAGTTGGTSYELPATCWTRRRTRGGTTKGYRCRQPPCKVALSAKKGLRAVCKGGTGDFGPLPEAGPVDVTLTLGSGTGYCARCGGTAKGKATKVFKRTACDAPAACP